MDERLACSPDRPEQGGGREAADGVFAAIGDALANGEEVRIAEFGAFGAKNRPARTGRNPRTGEALSISASTPPTFKAGKTLKDAVNVGSGPSGWNLRRPRMATTQTARLWNTADCYAMTGTLRAAGTVSGTRRRAVGLTAGPIPVWMPHHI